MVEQANLENLEFVLSAYFTCEIGESKGCVSLEAIPTEGQQGFEQWALPNYKAHYLQA